MRTSGWRYPVQESEWAALSEHYASAPGVVQPIADVVHSIAKSPTRKDLLFTTSMWDLVVTTAPATPPPVDVVVVRGFMGMRHVTAGRVVIEHVPLVGKADAIERDASEAVPLFWRFMIEKYGLGPNP